MWRLDIAGFGQSGEVKDGFMSDPDYAADDFQRDDNGGIDYTITEPEMIEMICSSCWHYDGEHRFIPIFR